MLLSCGRLHHSNVWHHHDKKSGGWVGTRGPGVACLEARQVSLEGNSYWFEWVQSLHLVSRSSIQIFGTLWKSAESLLKAPWGVEETTLSTCRQQSLWICMSAEAPFLLDYWQTYWGSNFCLSSSGSKLLWAWTITVPLSWTETLSTTALWAMTSPPP